MSASSSHLELSEPRNLCAGSPPYLQPGRMPGEEELLVKWCSMLLEIAPIKNIGR